MIPESVIWAIFLLPLLSFIVISLVLRPFFSRKPELSGYITIATIAISLALSIWVLSDVIRFGTLSLSSIEWVPIGSLEISIGLFVDKLTAVMLIVVSSVSLLVQIYSQGYMRGDPGYCRYFAFMSLFTASMLGLVLASNLLLLYVFWELVGLCSYLLIGFWFHRPKAAAAAKKAFIVTRIGDFGFLIAIIYLYFQVGTFNIIDLPDGIQAALAAGTLSTAGLTLACLGIFSGAVGKSAQFPLHVWLPDAMEGPTPVSALIHAATMVAAGVYLVARTFNIFTIPGAEGALTTVAIIGGFTAIFAATMGLVMNDIKRVLAYSTISQLGYMMLGLGMGIGGVAIAIFHLFNHAYFKSLLFLGAGSANHATGTFDMREMGGLRKFMPWTFATFLVASLALAGIFPFCGFFSKDQILAHAWSNNPILFWLAMITVFLTAFYIFRVVFMTFGGKYRGKSQPSPDESQHKLHESPKVMLIPMVLLAVMCVISGFLPISGFLGGESHSIAELFTGSGAWMTWLSLLLAGLGILLAYAMYSAKWLSPERMRERFRPIYTLFSRKYWLDELYERVIVVRLFINAVCYVCHLFDVYVVDGIVNGIASGTIAAGGGLRKAQTGQLQAYGLIFCLGVLGIFVVVLVCFLAFGG
jgi:NADH-quinone oxidoreductase subunit L